MRVRRVLVVAGCLVAAVVVVGAFVLVGLLPSFGPRSITADPSAVPLALDGTTGLPTVQVMVNGRGPYEFIVDTGAEATIVRDDLARELGLGVGLPARAGRPGGGGIAGRIARVDSISIGRTQLQDLDAVVLDLSAVWHELGGPRGILSVATLRGVLVTLDLRGRTLGIAIGSLPPADGVTTFAWAKGSSLPTVGVEVGGRPIVAMVDSGSRFGFTLPDHYADELALVGRPIAGTSLRGVDGGLVTRSAVLAGTGRIGTHTIDAPELSFANVAGATVGFRILGDFRLVVDAANRLIRLD